MKKLEALKRQVVALLLAWHMPINVSLRCTQSSKSIHMRSKKDFEFGGSSDGATLRTLDLSLVCSFLSQAGYIQPSEWSDWIKTSARTPFVTIRGAISLRPAPSRHVQFISLGFRPIISETGCNVLFDEVNRLFASSSFGNQADVSDNEDGRDAKRRKVGRFKKDGFTNKQLKGGGKGVDKWPMFYICIEMHRTHISYEGDVEKLGEGTLTGLIKVLRAMVTGFLDENHFQPRAKLRVRKRPETKAPDILGIKANLQTPRVDAAPLKASRQLQDDDVFGTWSRIKSGIRVKSSGESPLTCAFESQKAKVDSTPTANLESGSSVASIIEASIEPQINEGPINASEETMVEWRNPVSGATVMVNARTGLVVQKLSSIRPATAPSRLSFPKGPKSSNSNATITVGVARSTAITTSSATATPEARSRSNDFLRRWKNPVFAAAEESIPQVSLDGPSPETSDILHGRRHCCSDTDIQKAFTQASSTFTAKLTRQALKNARVIAQVDQKFILVCMSANPTTPTEARDQQLLVLIDQHAADERIRVEALLADLNASPSSLPKPLVFEIPDRELPLLARHIPYFASWGIIYTVIQTPTAPLKCKITVTSLPTPIAERCRIEPKLLIDLLRGEAWKRDELGLTTPKPLDQSSTTTIATATATKEDWLKRLSTCPRGLLDMLNSRACRSAIMFNDRLEMEECQMLVGRLGECRFPFQCAHGRPSMVPLVEVGEGEGGGGGDEGVGFGEAWGRWKG